MDINAQDPEPHSNQERKQLTRKEKKLQREEEAEKYLKNVYELVEARTFVFASEFDTVPMILVDSSFGALAGPNMIEGKVTDYDYNFNEKKQSYSLSFTLKSPYNSQYFLIYSIPGNKSVLRRSDDRLSHIRSRTAPVREYTGLMLHPSQIPSHHYEFYFHFINRPAKKE